MVTSGDSTWAATDGTRPRQGGAKDVPTQFDSVASLPVHAMLLLAALAAGVVAQGDYYTPGRAAVVAVTVTAAGIAAWPSPRLRTGIWPLLAACAGLALWTVITALVHNGPGGATPIVTGLVCLAGGAVVMQRTGAAQREAFAVALIGVATLVAVAGWLGVAWHRTPWASVVEGRLWRAASTLTYANAAAALLAALSLLALACIAARPRSSVRVAAAYLSMVGLAATLSRAGAVAFGVGLVVLLVLTGLRTAWQVLPALLGAAVALAGLAASMPASASAHPALAIATLLLGGVLAVGLSRLPGRPRRAALVAGLVLAGAGGAVMFWSSHGVRLLAHARITLDSSERVGATGAALRLIAGHPWIGSGPGRSRYVWTAPDGQLQISRYAHDEYLQLAAELGVIGLILLLAVLAAAVVTVRQGRRYAHQPAIRAGAIAALAALAVHSGFDFLWQLAVIPLAGGLLIGIAGPCALATGGTTSTIDQWGKE